MADRDLHELIDGANSGWCDEDQHRVGMRWTPRAEPPPPPTRHRRSKSAYAPNSSTRCANSTIAVVREASAFFASLAARLERTHKER